MDPFTILYNSLWTAVIGSPLADLIAKRNRIDFVQPNSLDLQVSNADLPELVLVPFGGDGNLHQSSCSSRCTRQYGFYISTGDQRLREQLFPVEWELFVMLINWQKNISSITWQSKTFVKRVELLSLAQSLSDPARNRGIKGWSSSWMFEVEMHFSHVDILEE